jgi:hypothetical protein
MKHLKTFENFAINEDWLDDVRNEKIVRNREKIKEMNIKPGDFVSLSGEYHDVWHEIANIYGDDSIHISVYKAKNAKQPEVKTDLVNLANVTKFNKTLPSNTRCFALKTGYYSPNTGNLSEIPTYYKRDMGIGSIVDED